MNMFNKRIGLSVREGDEYRRIIAMDDIELRNKNMEEFYTALKNKFAIPNDKKIEIKPFCCSPSKLQMVVL